MFLLPDGRYLTVRGIVDEPAQAKTSPLEGGGSTVVTGYPADEEYEVDAYLYTTVQHAVQADELDAEMMAEFVARAVSKLVVASVESDPVVQPRSGNRPTVVAHIEFQDRLAKMLDALAKDIPAAAGSIGVLVDAAIRRALFDGDETRTVSAVVEEPLGSVLDSLVSSPENRYDSLGVLGRAAVERTAEEALQWRD
ncbi:hypothetical protein [Haloarchaeobius sp. DFWS5]|uniref:hypothetical protein n=1 Tax=Haloarchaeobius sp. DFWS5 TaxID=3446114 RepID=UPI003EB85D68